VANVNEIGDLTVSCEGVKQALEHWLNAHRFRPESAVVVERLGITRSPQAEATHAEPVQAGANQSVSTDGITDAAPFFFVVYVREKDQRK
jgi:hypothetical protein